MLHYLTRERGLRTAGRRETKGGREENPRWREPSPLAEKGKTTVLTREVVMS
jgi:hypothetical protein